MLKKTGFSLFAPVLLFLLTICAACEDDDSAEARRLTQRTPENSWTLTENARQYCIEMCDQSVLDYHENDDAALFSVSRPNASDDVPRVLVIGGIHGNEQISVYIALKMIELAGQDETYAQNVELVFYPVMNPYGLDNNTRYTKSRVDLNRHFPFKWQNEGNSGDSPLTEPEALVIAEEAARCYSVLITFHTGAFCMSTLWDYIGTTESEGFPADYAFEEFIARYCPAYDLIDTSAKRYEQLVNEAGGSAFYAIEGFDWYSVYGSICDWYYYNYGTIGYTVELDYRQNDTSISTANLQKVWSYHNKALRSLFEVCDGGIRGQASSGIKSGSKILAKKITRSESESKDPLLFTPLSYVRESGYYHIPVPAGEYTLTFIDPDNGTQSTMSAVAQ